jgi:DNA-binding response OmpR family regulator
MTSILIIEDNKDLMVELSDCLELSGFKVYETDNGRSAVELAKSLRPDLIICDIMIPYVDGFNVLSQLKNTDATYTIPFIFITSLTDRGSYRTGMELGADDYLTKPFTEKELVTAINIRLEKHQKVLIENLSSPAGDKPVETDTTMRQQIHHQQKLLGTLTQSKKLLSESLQKTENELQELIIKSIDNAKILDYLKNQLNEKLKIKNLSDEHRNTMLHMSHSIDRTINKKDTLKIFLFKFNQINPEFFMKIINAYPKLTQLELTLISAIRLNLNTTQIASLLFISPESVRKYRYRLKKKLNLSPGVSLFNFIMSF